MPFIVEDGTGLTTANSYIDLTFANEYHSDRGETEWASATDENKQFAIVKGTQYLDSHFIFKSTPLKATQSLKFPRTEYSNLIPLALKKAVAVYSLFALRDELYDSERVEITGNLKKQVRKEKVGPLETETQDEFIGSGTIREIQENRFDSIQYLIYPYIIQKNNPNTVINPTTGETYAELTGELLTDRS